MLKSMTGFGRSEQLKDGYLIKVQIKSVNHRYSDININVPRYYAFLEDKIRNAALGALSRGKIEINVNIENKESSDKNITLSHETAAGYVSALRELTELGIADDLTITSMVNLPGLFDVEYKEIDEDKISDMVLEVFGDALDGFIEMREDEGKRLAENLKGHLTDLMSEVDIIEKRSPECVSEYRERLRKRLEKVLENYSADETRIITEAAIFADKTAVDEELVRLRSHVSAFEKTMTADEPVGKKLDFIVQEMNREANTTGSKCSDADIASHVVELKSIIEKIREQIQNIE